MSDRSLHTSIPHNPEPSFAVYYMYTVYVCSSSPRSLCSIYATSTEQWPEKVVADLQHLPPLVLATSSLSQSLDRGLHDSCQILANALEERRNFDSSTITSHGRDGFRGPRLCDDDS